MSDKTTEDDLMLVHGDCVEVMRSLDENTFDAIVTDPPYGLEFMGKEWDKLWRKGDSPAQKACQNNGIFRGVNPRWRDITINEWQSMQLWHTQWLTEAYRVMKPGGSMLVMGGTRTFHRLACAIEDSGFVIKDTLMWLYGSGFPKAQDLGKMIDKRMGAERERLGTKYDLLGHGKKAKGQLYHSDRDRKWIDNPDAEAHYVSLPNTDLAKHWDGFKVGGIKPAYEPIIWAVKPPEGSYIDNVLKWGVGAVNVDECRVGTGDNLDRPTVDTASWHGNSWSKNTQKTIPGEINKGSPQGRFPANVILSHHPECEQVGVKRVKGKAGGSGKGFDAVKGFGQKATSATHGNQITQSVTSETKQAPFQTIEAWNCHPDCPVRLLDEQSGNLKSGKDNIRTKEGFFVEHGGLGKAGDVQVSSGDSGGASRFFYCAKASRSERNVGLDEENKNVHPTVKPIKLFEYLIKLVTREGQIILDPFAGSGTTVISAYNVGRECVGIDQEKDYIEIAKKRILHWRNKNV